MKWTLFILSVLMFNPLQAAAKFSPAMVKAAEKGKRNRYLGDGIVRGGDPLAHPTTLADIRWAKRMGYERIVFDFRGQGSNWEQKLPPYFQVGLDPIKGRINVGVHNVTGAEVNQSQLEKTFTRSGLVKAAYIAPQIEGDLAVLDLKVTVPVNVETFYLVNPPRLILDIRAK